MGMFDYIKIDKSIKIPVSKEFKSLGIDPHDLEYQTKSLDNSLNVYEIRKNKKIYDENNKNLNYHGIIDFGSYYDSDTIDYFLDYKAKFTDGILKYIKLIKYQAVSHESRSEKNKEFIERAKKEKNRISVRLASFLERLLVVYPLNLLGFNFKQTAPGLVTDGNYTLVFYCPKIIIGYKKDRSVSTFGFSIDRITTEACFIKSFYRKELSIKFLGFGFSIFNIKYDDNL